MADWVHCNLCFHQPGDGRKFFLTNCGHVYCDECVNSGTKESCHLCKTPCTKILLSSKMKPDVEIFFTDPIELVKKQHKQLIQIMDFQKNHRERLTAYIREKMCKQGDLMAQARKSVSQNQDLEREIRILKEENAYLKKLISMGGGSSSRQGTPGGMRVQSPAHSQVKGHSSSPSGNLSPYNNPRTSSKLHQNMQDDYRHSVSADLFTTPPMPSRVSVRTPPSNGHLDSPSPTLNHAMHTHLSAHSASKASSPMSFSPASSQRTPVHSQLVMPSHTHSSGSLHSYSSQPDPHRSSQSDPNKRKIQLPFHQSSSLAMRLNAMKSSPQGK